jgi:type VI secretion system protein ImpJ
MLLNPQHFQQESARVDALVAWHGLAAQPYGWGLHRLVIDEALLSTGLLRVMSLEGVMPDGSAIQFSQDHAAADPLELDLSPWVDAMEQQGEVDIYLSLGRNRSMRDPGLGPRFREAPATAAEDEVSDALPIDIPRMRPHLRLSAQEVPPSVMVHLKLAAVRRENEVFRLSAFQPAAINLDASHPWRRRALALVTQQRSKAAFLSRLCTNGAASRIEDRLQLLETQHLLSCLSLQLPVLEALVRSPALHPHTLYLALCGQLGALALLERGGLPPMPPPWNQADPGSVLEPVFASIEEALGAVSQSWRTVPFQLSSDQFRVQIPTEGTGTRLVVGLRGAIERDLAAWMEGAVIGSSGVWASLVDRRVLGAHRTAIEEAPEIGLKGRAGYTLFSIEVLAEFINPQDELFICNPNDAAGIPRPRELVLFVKG